MQTLEQLQSGKLAGCTSIRLSCGLTEFPKELFDLADSLELLDLSGNQLSALPNDFGRFTKLKIAFFSDNLFTEYPEVLADCPLLEMIGFKANQIELLPHWLMTLPKLSWLAYSDNPCSEGQQSNQALKEISWNDLELKEQLGEGASGIISKAILKSQQKEIAVKVFKGEVTSDGLPLSEMNACALAGNHDSLVSLLGKIIDHPQQKEGLVFELIPNTFRNLGKPPSFISCTRDVFDKGTQFSKKEIFSTLLNTASVLEQLHSKGIMHGDFYAHNLMIDADANILLGDFGAATLYDLSSSNALLHEQIDVRAFGCLIDDLLVNSFGMDEQTLNHFNDLKTSCFNEVVSNRPTFKEIYQKILSVN